MFWPYWGQRSTIRYGVVGMNDVLDEDAGFFAKWASSVATSIRVLAKRHGKVEDVVVREALEYLTPWPTEWSVSERIVRWTREARRIIVLPPADLVAERYLELRIDKWILWEYPLCQSQDVAQKVAEKICTAARNAVPEWARSQRRLRAYAKTSAIRATIDERRRDDVDARVWLRLVQEQSVHRSHWGDDDLELCLLVDGLASKFGLTDKQKEILFLRAKGGTTWEEIVEIVYRRELDRLPEDQRADACRRYISNIRKWWSRFMKRNDLGDIRRWIED